MSGHDKVLRAFRQFCGTRGLRVEFRVELGLHHCRVTKPVGDGHEVVSNVVGWGVAPVLTMAREAVARAYPLRPGRRQNRAQSPETAQIRTNDTEEGVDHG